MRVARYAHDGTANWGFVEDDSVRPVASDVTMREALAGGKDALDRLAGEATTPIRLDDVQLLAPIPDPPQFMGIGLNYRRHAQEAGVEIPSSPISFGFLNSAIVATGEPIRLPPFTDQVDWEVELGIVVGVGGRDIAVEDAMSHVAGYTIINDVSARDIQFAEGQWTRSKSFDTFKPMGPWITTVDELGNADDLSLELRINDEIKQASTTADLIFDVPNIISFLSSSLTLMPGAVISTGTPSGVGFARDPEEYLQEGDTVSLTIEGIGTLTNHVVVSPISAGTPAV